MYCKSLNQFNIVFLKKHIQFNINPVWYKTPFDTKPRFQPFDTIQKNVLATRSAAKEKLINWFLTFEAIMNIYNSIPTTHILNRHDHWNLYTAVDHPWSMRPLDDHPHHHNPARQTGMLWRSQFDVGVECKRCQSFCGAFALPGLSNPPRGCISRKAPTVCWIDPYQRHYPG